MNYRLVAYPLLMPLSLQFTAIQSACLPFVRRLARRLTLQPSGATCIARAAQRPSGAQVLAEGMPSESAFAAPGPRKLDHPSWPLGPLCGGAHMKPIFFFEPFSRFFSWLIFTRAFFL